MEYDGIKDNAYVSSSSPDGGTGGKVCRLRLHIISKLWLWVVCGVYYVTLVKCITPVLEKLHWLPIRRQVEFKLSCLVHSVLAGQTPVYLASDIQLIADTDRPQLRSTSERVCVVPRTQQFRRQKFLCCRSSSVERLADICATGHELQYRRFKHSLKGHMFRIRSWRNGTLGHSTSSISRPTF